jgi:hypothetical protein
MPLNFTGLFATDAAYQQAQAEFLGIDTPSVLADAAWGLHPIPRLTVSMTGKLADVPQTTVNVRGVAGRMPTGSTALYGTPAIGGNRLLGARYVTGFHGADQEPRYRVRMAQDTVANATLPPGV